MPFYSNRFIVAHPDGGSANRGGSPGRAPFGVSVSDVGAVTAGEAEADFEQAGAQVVGGLGDGVDVGLAKAGFDMRVHGLDELAAPLVKPSDQFGRLLESELHRRGGLLEFGDGVDRTLRVFGQERDDL